MNYADSIKALPQKKHPEYLTASREESLLVFRAPENVKKMMQA
jgi:hypothetical protein